MHPREKRSALQSGGVQTDLQVRARLVLIGGIATQTFPGPITSDQGSHIVVSF